MKKVYGLISSVLTAVILLTACQQPTDPYDPVVRNSTWEYDGTSKLYVIDSQGADEVNVTVDGSFNSDSMYLVKANLNETKVSSPGEVTLSGNISGMSKQMSPADGSSSLTTSGSSSGPIRESFVPVKKIGLPPATTAEEGMDGRSLDATASLSASTVDYGTTSGPALGDTKVFWNAIPDGSGDYTWEEVTAVLKAKGYYTYVWVDQSCIDSSTGGPTNDNKIDQNQIDALLEAFDGTDGTASADGVYEWVSTLYGYERGGGTTGDGGIDEDRHVSIFVTDIYDDYSSIQTSGIFGYFWSKDDWSDSELYDEFGWHSNESEMFYIDTHFTDKNPAMMESTLAHEYQHMINYNQKKREHGVTPLPAWYNEMLSLLTEDLLQDKLGLSDSSSPKNRTGTFNENYYSAGVTEWGTSSSTLHHYAVDYVFGAFLARNYGGGPLAAAIMNNGEVGRTSITSALATVGKSEDFNTVFREFSRSLLFESSAGEFKAMDIGSRTDSVDGVDYTLSGYNIYDYSNGSYYGPGLFEIDSEPTLRPYGVSLHTTSGLQGLDGSQRFELSIDRPRDGVEYYLVVK